MKKLIYILSLLVFLVSCSSDPEPYIPEIDFNSDKKASQLISSDNAFAMDLFREVHSLTDDENYMISPLSVAIALGMTYNGSDMDTKTAFEETLRLNGLSRSEINRIHGSLIKLLMKIDPKVRFEVANSIWVNQYYTLQEEFADTNRYYYNAEINSMDFSDGSAKDIINAWCEDATNGKVKEVLDQIPPDIVMYLINALYFYGSWTYEFDKEDNRPILFQLEEGGTKTVDGMRLEAGLNVLYKEKFSMLELPYGNEKYSMVIMLPGEENNIEDILEDFNSENWNLWVESMSETNLTIHIPKFKYEFKTLLNEPLMNMGLGVAFGSGADFSLMVKESRDLYISRVIHKTFIDVNEKGTEAAAVTVVEIRETSAGPGTEFVVDKPFVYVIKEKTSGAIVFMGKVGDPG